MAVRGYPLPKVWGSNQERQAATAQEGSREGLPHVPRSGAPPERSYPTSKEWLLRRRWRAKRSYSMFKVRRGGREKIPLVQGKEERLHFAGAAMKRYPTSQVRETRVRR